MKKEPPFDGSGPCPMCPSAMRNLYAVAHNLTIDASDTTIGDLRRAVESAKPYLDKHFADSMHSHGRLPLEDVASEDTVEPPETGGEGT